MLFEHWRQKLADIDIAVAQYSSKDIDVSVELVEDRISTQAQLDNIIYPVLTLPPELTSEIFIQCVEFDSPPTHPCGGPPGSAPLILLQICREWRTIALSTPLLWTAGFNLLLGCSRSRDELVDEWLRRACGLPVSVRLYSDEAGNIERDAARCLLRNHAYRLGHLQLRLDYLDLCSVADIGKFPALRTLTLWGFRGHPTPVRQVIDVPLLREVSLEYGAVPSLVRLPWAQLTHFTCAQLSIDDCMCVLRDCSALKTCTLTGMTPSSSGRPGIFSHIVLESLTLGLGRDLAGGVHLDAFPSLNHLSLAGWSEDGARAFLLSLNRTENSDFLPHLSSLQILVDPGFTVDTPVVEALCSRHADSNEEAKLECLRLLYDFVNYSLCWDEVGNVDWDALYELWVQGMDIHVGQKGEEGNFLFYE
ncbi:hypothetical protein C8R43DRAFT_978822 [Mycena crocata]|nr:hypothetical protein C8R43DRAFT_978822 [Mycena crocata]